MLRHMFQYKLSIWYSDRAYTTKHLKKCYLRPAFTQKIGINFNVKVSNIFKTLAKDIFKQCINKLKYCLYFFHHE